MSARRPKYLRRLLSSLEKELLKSEPDLEVVVRQLQDELQVDGPSADTVLYSAIAELNRAILPPLSELELMLTNRCNLACRYCFERQIDRSREMRFETAARAVDLLVTYSAVGAKLSVVLFGGEPLLAFPLIRELIPYARQRASSSDRQISFSTTTNTTLLDEEHADFLVANNVAILMSVDGMRESHDLNRIDHAGRGSFAKCERAIRILRGYGQRIGIKMTVMPENAHRLADDVMGLYGIGVRHFIIGHATGIQWPLANTEAFTTALRQIVTWKRSLLDETLRIEGDTDPPGQRASFGCRAGRTSITVTTNGLISGCSKLVGARELPLVKPLGNLRWGLYCLRNRLEMATVSRLKQNGRARGFDRGGCFATNFDDTGDPYMPSQRDFEFTKIRNSAVLAELTAPTIQSSGPRLTEVGL